MASGMPLVLTARSTSPIPLRASPAEPSDRLARTRIIRSWTWLRATLSQTASLSGTGAGSMRARLLVLGRTLSSILLACPGNLHVEIQCASLSNPDPEYRVIQPHTVVHNGMRWLVRA